MFIHWLVLKQVVLQVHPAQPTAPTRATTDITTQILTNSRFIFYHLLLFIYAKKGGCQWGGVDRPGGATYPEVLVRTGQDKGVPRCPSPDEEPSPRQ